MRKEKQFLLDEVKDKIVGSNGFIVARYKGLTADKVREFRDKVAEAKGDFEVVRKRVFAKASESAGIKLDVREYEGHLGVLFGQGDIIDLSRIAVRYGEENEKAIEIVAAFIDGELQSGEEVTTLAGLPGLEGMRALFLSTLVSPLSQTVGVIDAAVSRAEEKPE